MYEVKMRTYYYKKDNMIIAQNCVMGQFGQEHKHTLEDWEVWKQNAPEIELINLDDKREV